MNSVLREGLSVVIESLSNLGDGIQQVSVQVTALNAQDQPEPWVDEEFSGTGLITWRLDVGTADGGGNSIGLDTPFTVVDSGVSAFDSAGDRLGDFSLDDSSDSNGLSGAVWLGLGDDDIAGFDLSSMVMYWNIEVEPGSSGFEVTGGQSGAWYDPTHSGEGYVLQIISKTKAIVYWFTYDKDGNQYWIIGSNGEINGSKITFNDLLTTRGGKFGPDFDPEEVEAIAWGSLQFDFSDCNNAVVTYQGPSGFGSGTLNVTRLSSIWGVACTGSTTVPSGTGAGYLSPGFSGSWYDYRHDGEGFTLEIIDEVTALIYWFTYDTEGNQAWMMMIGEIQGASILAVDVYTTSGGKFGPQFDPDDVVLDKWGSAVFSFGTCATSYSQHGGSMRYLPPPSYGIESTQLLTRLNFIESLDCIFLSGTYDVYGQMTVAENIFLDGDVNDPSLEEIPNNEPATAQQLVSPAKVAGFVTAEPTGKERDRFETRIDEADAYILALREGEGVSLVIADWDPEDKGSIDLDLYLYDENDLGEPADSSMSVDEKEIVFAPRDGNYHIVVHAFAGQSSYLLQSGQKEQLAGSSIDITAEFVSGQVMASLLDMNTLTSNTELDEYRSRIERTESKLGLTKIQESPSGNLLYQIDASQTWRLTPHPLISAGFGSIAPEEWLVIRVAKSLAANPDYRWVGPNYIHTTENTTPNDQYYSYQWHYPQIRLPEAWDISRGSNDVIVAVLDSGVYDHTDLASNVDYALGYDFVSDIFNSGDDDGIDSDAKDPGESYPAPYDYQSHGTHVAGTIGASTNNGIGVAGVNWNVTIMPVRICGINGSCSCFDINEGLRWAGRIANVSGRVPSDRPDIINMSLSGSSPCPGREDIINQLINHEIIVVAAAGNDDSNIPRYPASLPGVVSVSATTLSDELARYSNYGSSIDLAAPGGDMQADLNNDSYGDGVLSPSMKIEVGSTQKTDFYPFFNGTSMSSPHVAGVAGLMKSVYPDLGPDEFRTAFSSGEITVDLAQNGATSKDSEFGYGRIDALQAVQWAVNAEQGQQTDAFMTSSAAALNFSSNLTSMDLLIEKAGSGQLAVLDIGWAESWISVSSVDIDQDDFGRYRVSIDRGGLTEGQYTGEIAFVADNGSRLLVSILMRVGETATGEAGYMHALLLDQVTQQNVKSWHGSQVGTGFDIHLEDIPPGTYFLVVGTDIDNDYSICDDGDLCEVYLSNTQVSLIELGNSDFELGPFVMGFPVPDLESESASSSAVSNFMDAGKPVKQSPARIFGILRLK